MIEVLTWLAYAIALVLQWFKRWLVVRDYTKRPKQFQIPGPSGAIIIFGWIALALALFLLGYSYSVLVAALIGIATGLLIHCVTRYYFNREVSYWTKYFADMSRDFNNGKSEIVPGYKISKPPGSVSSDVEIQRFASETATRFVFSIRSSPIGKGSVDGDDE